MRELLTWGGVILLIGVGVAFVLTDECDGRGPSPPVSDRNPGGDSPGSGLGTGTGTGLGTGTGAGADASLAPPPSARRVPEVVEPGAHLVVSRRGVVMPAGTAPMAGDNVRFNVIVPEGETHYTALIAVSDGAASQLLATPEAQDDPHRVRGPYRFPGSLSLRPGGGLVHLLVVIRDEEFSVAALLRETERARAAGGNPAGTVAEVTVDLGR